jgi:hypothetical protein
MRKLVFTTFAIAGGMLVFQGGLGFAAAGGVGVKAFCRANLVLEKSDEPSKRQLERLRTTAPDEIADTVDSAVTTFTEQGEAAFEDPSFQSAIAEIDQFLVDECGYKTANVTMADYSFEGIPARLGKGVVAFSLRNQGTELHEFTVGRLKGDATLDDVLNLPADASEKQLGKLIQPVPGGGFAFPGQSDVALIDLKESGKYVALCFIPVGTTPEAAAEEEAGGSEPGGAPHYHEGMAVQFNVKS